MTPQQRLAGAARKLLAGKAQLVFAETQERRRELQTQVDFAIMEAVEAMGLAYGRRLFVSVLGLETVVAMSKVSGKPLSVFGTQFGYVLECFGARPRGDRGHSHLHQTTSLATECTLPTEAAQFMVLEYAMKVLEESLQEQPA